ncbi:MAG: peptidylprolyl isomerase [Candidatus Saccharimonadales bacterium]
MKKPKLKKIKNIRSRIRERKESLPAIAGGRKSVPRITNETIAAHREEVISGARKHIYPLRHTANRIIFITSSLLVVGVIAFFSYCTLALYRFKSTSEFTYRVTQVIPFPIARVGGSYVSYESYLFEIRHYVHYYEQQQKVDFNSPEGKQQLKLFKKQAIDKVINDAYIKKLAAKQHVTVTSQQIDDQIKILRAQNRLGGSDKVFEDVLRDYWGWSVKDFRRSLSDSILTQNLAESLDTATTTKATAAEAKLNSGTDFAAVAKEYSDDTATKDNGGDIGVVDSSKRDLTAQTVSALYKLKPGQYSPIINIGYSLEILKNIETMSDGKIHGAHILFNFKDITPQLNDMKDKQKARVYVTF